MFLTQFLCSNSHQYCWWDVQKPCKYWDKLPTSTGDLWEIPKTNHQLKEVQVTPTLSTNAKTESHRHKNLSQDGKSLPGCFLQSFAWWSETMWNQLLAFAKNGVSLFVKVVVGGWRKWHQLPFSVLACIFDYFWSNKFLPDLWWM